MGDNAKQPIEGLKCSFCGMALPPTKRQWKRYCNRKCKMAAWEREHPRQKIRDGDTITVNKKIWYIYSTPK